MDELDISWVNELEISHKTKLSPPQYINIHFIYININYELIHTYKMIYDLKSYTKDESIINKEELLKIIQLNKSGETSNNTKYRLSEILEYVVDIHNESKTIETINKELESTSIKKINYIDDIKFKPSITNFHTINTLYLIYIEKHDHQQPPKPTIKILQTESQNKTQPSFLIKKKTKKVRFDNLEKNLNSFNHTKKKT